MNWEQTIPYPQLANELSSDEIISYCRAWRNHQLAITDYTQLSDVPLNNKSDWAIYRQSLRDLTAQGPDPKLWVFPVPPI
jgi:hypothetical protein